MVSNSSVSLGGVKAAIHRFVFATDFIFAIDENGFGSAGFDRDDGKNIETLGPADARHDHGMHIAFGLCLQRAPSSCLQG